MLRYAQAEGTITLGALLMLASAPALVLLTVVAYRRLRAFGAGWYGCALTLAGGVLAATALIGSAIFMWLEAGTLTAVRARSCWRAAVQTRRTAHRVIATPG